MTTFPLVRPKMAIEILVSNFAEKRLKLTIQVLVAEIVTVRLPGFPQRGGGIPIVLSGLSCWSVLSFKFCCGCHVTAILSWLSCVSGLSDIVVPSWILCHFNGCPVILSASPSQSCQAKKLIIKCSNVPFILVNCQTGFWVIGVICSQLIPAGRIRVHYWHYGSWSTIMCVWCSIQYILYKLKSIFSCSHAFILYT